jgi:hypothetical protein
MKVEEALKALGADRVIWIDDHFNNTPEKFAKILLANQAIAAKCEVAWLNEGIEKVKFGGAGAEQELVQKIVDLDEGQLQELKATFFKFESEAKGMQASELSAENVEDVCKLLAIQNGDRWSFQDAAAKLQDLCANDARIGYMIDLNEAAGGPTEGLDVLKRLGDWGSKGTAFIMTHSSDIAGEVAKERELLDKLQADDNPQLRRIPICVVSKERITAAQSDEELQQHLRVAIKRAGLRRSVHEVLHHLESEIVEAVNVASRKLLEIPPEQFDEFVVKRGYQEGMSELHVVERAITAQVSNRVREKFAKDEVVLGSTARVRSLRAVQLAPVTQAHEHLDSFRRLEVWESDALINGSFSPLSCGDVFETDQHELSTAQRRFVLLAQPCDIALRGEGKRAQEVAFLVELKPSKNAKNDEGKQKVRLLQFKLDGQQWLCDFRNASAVSLNVLDLACFRADGRVRFDLEQETKLPLLAGLGEIIGQRTAAAKEVLNDKHDAEKVAKTAGLRLCFRADQPFKSYHHGSSENKATRPVDGQPVKLPARVTWRLRRCGRIRMPYASALLREYLAEQAREAFDLDFTKDPPAPAPVPTPPAVAAAAPMPLEMPAQGQAGAVAPPAAA